MKKLSVISLALNEEKNLPELHAELIPVLESLGMDWEWIIIDDHSSDSTPDVISVRTVRFQIRGLRMAKTEGATALCFLGDAKSIWRLCGDACRGRAGSAEVYTPAHREMKKGKYKVVWLTREGGRGDPFFQTAGGAFLLLYDAPYHRNFFHSAQRQRYGAYRWRCCEGDE